jgi:hypothetical protein
MFSPSYFHYSVDMLLFVDYDEYIPKGKGGSRMQTITRVTAMNGKSWQSRIV